MPIPTPKATASSNEIHTWDGVSPTAYPETYGEFLQWNCVKPIVQYYHQEDKGRTCEDCIFEFYDVHFFTPGTWHQICGEAGRQSAQACDHCGRRVSNLWPAASCVHCIGWFMDITLELYNGIQKELSYDVTAVVRPTHWINNNHPARTIGNIRVRINFFFRRVVKIQPVPRFLHTGQNTIP